ncbi:MAG: phosphate-starvation-inducible PsiE family protein [Saprospiraceae bacterium]|uniref:Phosphate-starvation-inducible PsiE family protein n=1 Tax=Candidatus Defluviibacterium haderslevense TaxID=2981993 RepID=A0A9D7XFQ3_9BACT|nr:phosphate-starvation-inducible PsiE family protein [Candidatus Defluviibacterium haderslevense]
MNLIKYFEKAAFIFCGFIIGLFVVSEAVEVVYSIYSSLVTTTSSNELLLHDTETDQIIKSIFNIFIGLELLQTIKMYFEEKVIRGEMILLIALTAISRKLITMDYAQSGGMENIGLGILIAALGLGYYFINKTNSKREI